jgi:uncharacterized Zn-finger protein
MVRKKGIPVRNLKNDTLKILTERVEKIERMRVQHQEEIARQMGIRSENEKVKKKKHVCHVCDKECVSPSALDTHMFVHNGLKPFKCHLCEYASAQSGGLTYHLRTHSGEKPFKCHVCEYACTQSGNLKTHILRNHDLRSTSAKH